MNLVGNLQWALKDLPCLSLFIIFDVGLWMENIDKVPKSIIRFQDK